MNSEAPREDWVKTQEDASVKTLTWSGLILKTVCQDLRNKNFTTPFEGSLPTGILILFVLQL